MSKPPQFDLQPTLVGETITLLPLHEDDFESLFEAASDPLLWEQHPDPLRYQRDVFMKNYFSGALSCGSAFVIIHNESGDVIGSSRFYNWNPESREVAIGYTFLTRAHWGGAINGELKTLMLDHAFRWARIVWFHIGKHNVRSRKALEKIGGHFSHEEIYEMNGAKHDYVHYRIDAPQWRGVQGE